MAIEKYTAPSSQVSVLTTELDSLGSATFTSLGSEYDNSGNLDMFAIAEFNFTMNVDNGAEGYMDLFCLPAYDGTNYPDTDSTVGPSSDHFVCSLRILEGTSAQYTVSQPFKLPPSKCKFVLGNQASEALVSSGNTVKIRTFNREIA